MTDQQIQQHVRECALRLVAEVAEKYPGKGDGPQHEAVNQRTHTTAAIVAVGGDTNVTR